MRLIFFRLFLFLLLSFASLQLIDSFLKLLELFGLFISLSLTTNQSLKTCNSLCADYVQMSSKSIHILLVKTLYMNVSTYLTTLGFYTIDTLILKCNAIFYYIQYHLYFHTILYSIVIFYGSNRSSPPVDIRSQSQAWAASRSGHGSCVSCIQTSEIRNAL